MANRKHKTNKKRTQNENPKKKRRENGDGNKMVKQKCETEKRKLKSTERKFHDAKA